MQILLLEPRISLAVSRTEFLKQQGYSVYPASGLYEALDVLTMFQSVKLAIIHHPLPCLVVEHLKEKRRDLGCIILHESCVQSHEAEVVALEPVENMKLLSYVKGLLTPH